MKQLLLCVLLSFAVAGGCSSSVPGERRSGENSNVEAENLAMAPQGLIHETANVSRTGEEFESGRPGEHALKIMMLGDSITADTCYPQLLQKRMQSHRLGQHRFVGSAWNGLTAADCDTAVKPMKTEGHEGYLITFLTSNDNADFELGTLADLQQWVRAKPDMVLLHMGTNDSWNWGIPVSNILSAYSFVMEQFRRERPDTIFFISRIIKMHPEGCDICSSNVDDLAAALTESWAHAHSTRYSPVRIIDHYASQFDPLNPLYSEDGVHPTALGARIMADVTFDALARSPYF